MTEAVRQHERASGRRYDAFDDAGVAAGIVHAAADREHDATLAIDGIRCAACSIAIEKALRAVPGVVEIGVNPSTRHANLSWDPSRVRFSEILEAIAVLGFEPHPLQRDTRTRLNLAEYRAALRRLIVAGLGMMQVMTYAVATYAGAFDGISATYAEFFRLLSLLVATPVVFYAAAPFFRAAARDLSQRRVGMDVPVALAIGIAYATSVGIVFFGHPAAEVYFDSVVMFTFFLSCGRFAEMIARHRTLAVTDALSGSLPATALRVLDENGATEHVALAELRPGDRVLVRPGDTIPADGTIARGESATDESLLTGESRPRTRRAGDEVIAGSINLSAPLQLRITRTGPDTMLSGIARLLERAQGERPRLARFADTVAGWFVAALLAVAVLVATAWLLVDPSRALTVTLSVLVVTCPCALSLATPAALTAATGFLARRGLLVTRGTAIETLARADTLLMDKTGTLTRGRLELVETRPFGDRLDAQRCLELAAALETGSAHPVAMALTRSGRGPRPGTIEVHPGAGIEGEIDARRYRIGTAAFVAAFMRPGTTGVPDPAGVSTHDGAVTTVFLGDRDGLLAAFAFADTLRPEAAATVKALRDRGLAPGILSGDTAGPVAHVAQALAIDDQAAGLLPARKLRELERRRKAGRIVAMLGDGINDAPVLAGADVSIAMGSGSMLAQASADFVLLGDRLDLLVTGVDHARATMRIVRQNVLWAVGYNLVALPAAALGFVAPWMAAIGMSASSLIVVLNALRLGRERRPAASPPAAPVGDSGDAWSPT